jgi:hypothetical protein
VRPTLRMAGVVALASIGVVAAGQDPAPSTRPARAARRRPIHDSVERVVDAVVQAHLKPCTEAHRLGVPCFPVSVEEEGPRFSVADALRRYRGVGSPAPGVPTVAEIQRQMSGRPLSEHLDFGSLDPVCTARKLFGKKAGTTFHLYRTWDAQGEHPLLTDHPLDPKAYAANLDFHYESLGEFDGECEAVAAWRKALRQATAPKPLPDDWDEVKADETPRAERPPEPPPPE